MNHWRHRTIAVPAFSATASLTDDDDFIPLAEAGAASRIAQLDPLRPVDDNFVLSSSRMSNSNTPIDEA